MRHSRYQLMFISVFGVVSRKDWFRILLKILSCVLSVRRKVRLETGPFCSLVFELSKPRLRRKPVEILPVSFLVLLIGDLIC